MLIQTYTRKLQLDYYRKVLFQFSTSKFNVLLQESTISVFYIKIQRVTCFYLFETLRNCR